MDFNMTAKNKSEAIEKPTLQARAAAHVKTACELLKALHTPAAKQVVEELEPYAAEISELKSRSYRRSL